MTVACDRGVWGVPFVHPTHLCMELVLVLFATDHLRADDARSSPLVSGRNVPHVIGNWPPIQPVNAQARTESGGRDIVVEVSGGVLVLVMGGLDNRGGGGGGSGAGGGGDIRIWVVVMV